MHMIEKFIDLQGTSKDPIDLACLYSRILNKLSLPLTNRYQLSLVVEHWISDEGSAVAISGRHLRLQ